MTGPVIDPAGLRLLTYNVHGLRAGTDMVARVIAAARPDVVCVQEAPAGFRWRTRGAELARRAGLYVVTGGRPAAGNLLLCSARVAVAHAENHLLARSSGLPARGCAAAVLRVDGVAVGVLGTHFGLRSEERSRHAAEVAAIADRLRGRGAVAIVLGADLNSKPHAGEWAQLRVRLRDTVPSGETWGTFPARAPTVRIDVVLAGPDVVVAECSVPEHEDVARASDHRPVLAVVRIPHPTT